MKWLDKLVEQGADPEAASKYLRFLSNNRRLKVKGLHAHHAVPRCLGGVAMGVVYLTPDAHARAHDLLSAALPTHDGLRDAGDLIRHRLDKWEQRPTSITQPPPDVDYSKMRLVVGKKFNIWVPDAG